MTEVSFVIKAITTHVPTVPYLAIAEEAKITTLLPHQVKWSAHKVLKGVKKFRFSDYSVISISVT